MHFNCCECHRSFRFKSTSVMHDSKIGHFEQTIAVYLTVTSVKRIFGTQFHRSADDTQRSAGHMAHRIRAAYSIKEERSKGETEIEMTNAV